MDLRLRLLGHLGLSLGVLLGVALGIQFHSLQEDIRAEVAASNRLVDALVAAGQGDQARLRDAAASLRHLRLRLAGDAGAPAAESRPDERRIRIGEQTLLISANPDSEISEREQDSVRLLITLLLFSGASLLLAWWVADRALRPVRELELSLQRLADGQADPALPSFALREFSRVALAIERLAVALGEARAAQRALARQLISLQEHERHTLARELHDDMGQTLTALHVTAAHLERHAENLDRPALRECAAELRRDLRHGREQLRQLLKTLRPHGLAVAGLRASLAELVDNWRIRGLGIEFAVSLPEVLPVVGEAAALALYRTLQEALTNVVRHSQASHCRVSLQCAEGQLQLQVEDDGCGLHQAGPARQGGLLGIAERVDMVGGCLRYGNRPEGGLRLLALIPLGGSVQAAIAD